MIKEDFDFEQGDCAGFAIALHKLTGFPLFALMEFDPNIGKPVLIHAYCKLPVKSNSTAIELKYPLVDSIGQCDLKDILERFPHSGAPYEIKITAKKLLNIAYTKENMPNIESIKPYVLEMIELNDISF